MSDDYAVLAPLYEPLGMAAFAETLTPQLIDYAQSHDWIGRRVVDLGCGTGASVGWLANHGYNVTGIDLSPSMLKVARQSITGSGISYQLLEGDIRALSDLHEIDLVMALDVLNELNNLRDLEAVFSALAHILPPDKLFIFDLHTIAGLAENHANTNLTDTDNLTVFISHQFDYERQAASDSYVIFRRDGGSGWQRQRAQRTLRGFPVQVIAALLQRAGFGIMALMNTRLEPIDLTTLDEARVIFFARRVHPESD